MIPTANKNPSAGTPDPNVSISSGTSSQPNKWQGVTSVADHTPVTKKSNVGISSHPMDDNIDHLTSAERDEDSNHKKFPSQLHAANKEGKSSPPIVYDLGKMSSVPPRPSHSTTKNQKSAVDTFEDNVPIHLHGVDHFSRSKHEDGALVDIEGGGNDHDGEVTAGIFPDAEKALPKKGDSKYIGDILPPKRNITTFDDTSTSGNRKDHHPSPIYDLGASSSTKLSTKISKRAHGLFARIPAYSQDKKKTATNNRQLNAGHSLSYSRKGVKGKNVVNNRDMDGKFHTLEMTVESQKLKIQESEEAEKIRTNNGLHDRADEMMVVKLSDFDALKMKLEELEMSQKEQRADIEAQMREIETQKQEIETQKQMMEELKESQRAEMEEMKESQREEIETQKREMEELKESQRAEMEYLKASQRAEMEVRKRQIQDLEASHEEVRALVPIEIPHGSDNSSPTHERSGTLPSAHDQTFLRRRISSTFRNYHILSNSNGDDENGTALERDTFSLMMISKVWSRSWALGMVAFLFQIVLGAMIAFDQNSQSTDSSLFNVPFKVKSVVRVGQFLTIILCLSTQSDILTSVQSVLLLGGDSDWDVVIGETGHKSTSLWIIRILIPNLMKSTQGLLVTFASFVIIVQSDDIIDLLKDFTALMVLSETDNILFDLASYGYLGKELMDQVTKVSDIKVPEEPTTATDTNPTSSSPSTIRCRKINCPFYFRYSVFLCLFGFMLGGWIMIVLNQMSGTYFYEKYPNCTFTYQGQDAFKLAKEHFGDETCWGGPLNSLECAFEGGDCIDFNIAYPLCKGQDDLINVQSSVGNGNCEKLFMILECAYDGGDCCSLEIVNSPLFGDNQCHGGMFNTAGCGFDNGDCNIFNAAYPQCSLAELGDIEGTEDFVLGDNVCNGIYSSVECGWENGDCDVGQIGQDFLVDSFAALPFEVLAVGRKRTMGILSAGIVTFYHYNDIERRWNPLGNFLRRVGAATITFAMSMNHVGGDRIAISSFPFEQREINWSLAGQVGVFDFVASDQTWAQVGQNIQEQISSFGSWIDLTMDGSRLVVSAPFHDYYAGGIYIYELNMADNWWDRLGNTIEGNADGEAIGGYFTHISYGGNTVIFPTAGYFNEEDVVTKIYSYDKYSQDWMQLGSDIPSPYARSSAISSNGKRIAVPSYSYENKDAPGEVRVFDYDEMNKLWMPVGATIISAQSQDGDGFGFDIAMSSDGNVLAISSVDQKCVTCASGSVHIYLFESNWNEFVLPYPRLIRNGNNVIVDRDRDRDNTRFGLWLSMSGDGSTLSITGYNIIDKQDFVRVYDLDQIFYMGCLVNDPFELGYGYCNDKYPFNSAECGFDGGDCPLPSPVEGYPGCMVSYPGKIGNGECNFDNLPMYNSTECGYDGGDCLPKPKPIDEYPTCFVFYPHYIGDGQCDSWRDPSYNSTECGHDGGDCLPKPVDGYPGCLVVYPDQIGNGQCDSWRDPSYNSTECGYDGGDCLPKPVDGYPGCLVLRPDQIGNGQCDSWHDPSYNSTECGYDGGDCLSKPVDGYPGCLVVYPEWIGDNYCSSDPSYNTTECGYDGGDCLP